MTPKEGSRAGLYPMIGLFLVLVAVIVYGFLTR